MTQALLVALLPECRDYELAPARPGERWPAGAGSEGVDSAPSAGALHSGGDTNAPHGGRYSLPAGGALAGEAGGASGNGATEIVAGELASQSGRPKTSLPCLPGRTLDSLQPFTAVAARRGARGAEQLYAVLPASSQLATTSRDDPNGSIWSPWQCFGNLSAASRLAATELLDGSAWVVATTRTNGLFARSDGASDMSLASWSSLELPRESARLDDVAAVRGAEHRTYLYVADAGRVFFRYSASAGHPSEFSNWLDLGFKDVLRLSATVLPNLAQIVFALKRDGTIEFAYQTETTPSASFGSVRAIPVTTPPSAVALAAALQEGAGVALWVLDGKGGVHATALAEERADPRGPWSQWLRLPDPPDYLQRFTSLAALSALEPNHRRMLYAVSDTGQAAYWGETDWQRLARAE